MGADLRTFPISMQQVRGWVDEDPSRHSRPVLLLLFPLLWFEKTAAPDRLIKNPLRETGNDSGAQVAKLGQLQQVAWKN